MLAGAAAEDDGDAGLAGGLVHRADPIRPRLVGMPEDSPALKPATIAVNGRPARPHEPDAPLNAPLDDGVDVRRGRRPRVRPLRQPDLGGVRGRARRARGRPLPVVRLRAGRGRDGARPGRQRQHGGRAAARLQRHRHAAGRPRGPRPAARRGWSTSPTPTRSSPRATDAALVWLESPTNPALEVADIPAIRAAAHEAGAYVVVDNTFATPLLQRPLDLGADLVVHSATKYLSGHSDVLLGAVVTRDDELYGVLKGRRDLLGASPGTLEAWLALRGLRTLHLRVERAQANAAGAGPPARRRTRRSARSATPASAAIVSIVLAAGRAGRRPARRTRRSCGCTPPPSAASSRRSSGAAAGRPSPPPSPRRWCGCRSASRTSTTSGPTSTTRPRRPAT